MEMKRRGRIKIEGAQTIFLFCLTQKQKQKKIEPVQKILYWFKIFVLVQKKLYQRQKLNYNIYTIQHMYLKHQLATLIDLVVLIVLFSLKTCSGSLSYFKLMLTIAKENKKTSQSPTLHPRHGRWKQMLANRALANCAWASNPITVNNCYGN